MHFMNIYRDLYGNTRGISCRIHCILFPRTVLQVLQTRCLFRWRCSVNSISLSEFKNSSWSVRESESKYLAKLNSSSLSLEEGYSCQFHYFLQAVIQYTFLSNLFEPTGIEERRIFNQFAVDRKSFGDGSCDLLLVGKHPHESE